MATEEVEKFWWINGRDRVWFWDQQPRFILDWSRTYKFFEVEKMEQIDSQDLFSEFGKIDQIDDRDPFSEFGKMEQIDGRDPFLKFGKMEQIDGRDPFSELVE